MPAARIITCEDSVGVHLQQRLVEKPPCGWSSRFPERCTRRPSPR